MKTPKIPRDILDKDSVYSSKYVCIVNFEIILRSDSQ